MDVAFNLLLDHKLRDQVREVLRGVEEIGFIDTELLAHDVLIVHTKRANARNLKQKLSSLEGVKSAELGAMAKG